MIRKNRKRKTKKGKQKTEEEKFGSGFLSMRGKVKRGDNDHGNTKWTKRNELLE